MRGPQGLEDERGGVVLQPAPGVQQQQRRRPKVELKERQRQRHPQPQHSAWVSPYLRRKGHHVSTSRPAQRTALKLNARARLQQKTLLLLEERELLDPGANNLLFVGANAQTNVMAVMMLQEAGYNVRTVVSLDELRAISAREGADELAFATDCVLVDFNVVQFSVDYVIRVLGGAQLLGGQMASRDIPLIGMSTRRSQRTQCAQKQGVFFVLKPPKPGPFKLVVRAALARHHNLQLARQRREDRGEWSVTPDAARDLQRLRAGGGVQALGGRAGDNSTPGGNHGGMSDHKRSMPAPHPLPFQESPAPTPPQTPTLELDDGYAYSSSVGDMDGNAMLYRREVVLGAEISVGMTSQDAALISQDAGLSGPRRQEDADYISQGDLDSYGYGDGAGAFGFGSLDVAPVESQTWSRGDGRGGGSRGGSGSSTRGRNPKNMTKSWFPTGNGDRGGVEQQQLLVQHFPQRPPSGGKTDFLRRRRNTPQKARRLARPKSMDGSRPLSDAGQNQFQMAALSEAEKLFGEISRS